MQVEQPVCSDNVVEYVYRRDHSCLRDARVASQTPLHIFIRDAKRANHVPEQPQLPIKGHHTVICWLHSSFGNGKSVNPCFSTHSTVRVCVQTSSASVLAHRSCRLVVTAEQKGKGAGRGGYPQDEEKAAQLKMVADKMDAFFASRDEAAFDAISSPDIILHADLLILDKDLSGADKVKQTVGMYTKNYDYKHQNIAHGADIDGSSVFHFWLHQVPMFPMCWHACVLNQPVLLLLHVC